MVVPRDLPWVLVLLLTASCVGCSSSARAEPRFASANPAVQEEFELARSVFEENRLDDAERLFLAFVAAHPDDPLHHGAELYLGRISYRGEQFQEAVVWLERAVAAADEQLSTTARRELGHALVQAGDPERAMAILEPMAGTLDGREAAELYEALAQAAEAADEPERQVRFLDAYCRFGGRQARDRARSRLPAAVETLDGEAVERLAGSLPRNGPGWAAVMSRLGQEAVDAGSEERIRELQGQLDEAGAREEAATLAAALEQMARVDWSAIGVLLPLSGRARLIGEQMRAGIEIAAENESGEPIRLIIRDTSSVDAEGMVGLVNELVADERVAAIIGPVDAARAAVAARRAEELGVPLLALSIRPELPDIGIWVFRAFQSNSADVRNLVIYAMSRRGISSFAVLHPDSSYGRVMSQIVEQEVTSRGGTVVVSRSYSPSTTSFVEPCRELADHEFEALLIPDRSRTVALVAPALATVGMWSQGPASPIPSEGRGVQLLLPSTSFDARLIRQAGRYLQGAVFSTAFWSGDTAPSTVRFVETYRLSRESAPSPYASQAHDAMQILRAARTGVPGRDRDGLRLALQSLEDADTLGRFDGFEGNGEPRNPFRLIEIDGETLRWVEPSADE